MTSEELRDYIDFLRSQDAISYDVYSVLIDGIDTLEEEQKWIPVSEMLPEDSGEYFVSIIDKYYDENYEDIGIAQFAHKKDYGIKESEWQIDETVIAWMPLPKPYLPDTNIGNMAENPTGSESEVSK